MDSEIDVGVDPPSFGVQVANQGWPQPAATRFHRSIAAILIAAFCAVATQARAQESPSEAQALARGWQLLAAGDAATAAAVAAEALQKDGNSSAALTLLVDAELVRGSAKAGLAAYDRWITDRRLDDAFVLRRIAKVLLLEHSSSRVSAAVRLDALKALAEDGDKTASAALEQAMLSRAFPETRVLASMGDERAVNMLIAQLGSVPGSAATIIDALAESGSSLPVSHLRKLLADGDDVTRAATADALGRLGDRDALPALRTLLNDPVFTVRLKAAGALYRLNDSSGLGLLNELAQSEHAAIRLAAARELASQPDAGWESLVRSLARDPDPAVRLEAAGLLAPYDQPAASEALQELLRDENIGIREAAAGVFVDRAATDFVSLRSMLHSTDARVRARAAARILELTR